MGRPHVFCAVGVLLLCLQAASGSVLMRYCDGLDWVNRQCTGNCYISYQDVPGGNATQWAWGPRGQRSAYCVEWWGQVTLPAGQCLIADADDGAQVYINNKIVIDKWNSFDPRGCPKKGGCQAGSGSLYVIYYQDYGQARFSLKTGACGATDDKFTALTASAFTGTPTIPANLTGQRLATLTNASCCYPSLGNCGTKTPCSTFFTPAEIASVAASSEVWRTIYWTGDGNPQQVVGPYILPCTNLLYLGANGTNGQFTNDDNIVLKVTIGSVTDYYKPVPGKNLCDMLMSNRLHLWSQTGEPFTFIQPMYHESDTTLGGSTNQWPQQFIPGDKRNYLSFWGGNGANGACCHDSKTSNSQWNREATLEIVPQLPGLQAPTLSDTLPSWTTPLTQWLPFSFVHGDWQTTWQTWYPLTENGLLNNWAGVTSGLFFHRQCGVYNQTGAGGLGATNKFIFAVCMGDTMNATATCTGRVDYFRAAQNTSSTFNLCDVLRSRTSHEWAYDTSSTDPTKWKWARPEPYQDHYGGSRDGWPTAFCNGQCAGTYLSQTTCEYDPYCKWNAQQNQCVAVQTGDATAAPLPKRCADPRRHLPFWGGHYGGHGYQQANPQQADWRKPYIIRLAKMA